MHNFYMENPNYLELRDKLEKIDVKLALKLCELVHDAIYHGIEALSEIQNKKVKEIRGVK